MKQLSQIIALYLPGANSLQIILILWISILLVRLLVTQTFSTRRKWMTRKKTRQIGNDMWAIE
jgi:cell division protein FtsL